MTKHVAARRLTGLFAAVVALFAAGGASALPLSYSPSSSIVHTGTFTIDQIHDGQSGATVANGFASKGIKGDITFTFANPVDIRSFSLFNNVIVDGVGGITKFSLEYFNAAGSMGSTTYSSVPGAQVAPYTQSVVRNAVTKIVMHILMSYGIEIREMTFDGLTRYDLLVDTSLSKDFDPHLINTFEYGIFVNSNQPMQAGTQLTVSGSAVPAAYFTPWTVLTPGWTCTGGWAAFQCVKTVGGGTTMEPLRLRTTSTHQGSTITYKATITSTTNDDPVAGNNPRSVSGWLN